jgi:hypothetical protein
LGGGSASPAGAEAPSFGEGEGAPWRFFLHNFYDNKKNFFCQAGFAKFFEVTGT